MVKLPKVKLGFIPANRGFFSDKLAAKMRNETVKVLKAIGAEARKEIEALLDAHVFLDLWVKVWKNWRKDPRALRTLGFQR